MTDPITFDRLGTITIDNDGEAVKLRRPKMGQWRHFRRVWDQAVRERTARAQELQDQISALIADTPKPHDETNPAYVAVIESDEHRKLVEAVREEASRLRDNPLYDLTIPWLQEVMKQLTDGQLGEPDDWPAFLADPSLPGKFLNHWQTVPKASGPSEPNP
jgi:hypothetical protein